MWLPRVGSVIEKFGAEPDVPTVTLPLYWVLPTPFSIPWYWKSLAPVVASVMTCSSLGVPSSWSPPTTVSYASSGLPSATQTTLRGAFAASVFFDPSACADLTAFASAAAGFTFAVVPATLIWERTALVTPLSVPPLLSCTTRSPPRTGSPS